MSQNDFIDQIKSMDKKDRRALLEKLTNALTPEQQNQVRAIMQDKKQMEKVQNNLKADDLQTLLNGLSGPGDPQDFLNSPQVLNRLKELLS
ncbi:MAG: hypothetical protein DBX52_00850 [Clostridiales bacterium]|nr:MAG: hypothetical protein DBX52_00850 [Clostridiales bacterium]